MKRAALGTSGRLILLLVLSVSLVYVFRNIDRGWVPHDEGTLAQPAVRILQGDLPHRDFDDMYTGGLSFFHALSFKVVGTDLLTLRLALFLAFALWVPAVFLIGYRLSDAPRAAVVTLLAVAWSVPNYPAAMPSWYSLFLTTWGVLALIRFEETASLRWLFVAGLLGGLSILVKIVGLYFVAAVLLYLIHRIQAIRSGEIEHGQGSAGTYTWVVTVGLLLFVLSVFALVAQHVTPEAVFYFFIPPACVAVFLAWTEWAAPSTNHRRDLTRLLRTGGTLLAGVVLPVALFLVPYAVYGGLGSLYRGVLVLPRERFFLAWRNPEALRTAVAALPVAGLMVAAVLLKRGAARATAAVAALVGTLLVLAGDRTPVYRDVWLGMRPLVPLVLVGGLVALGPGGGGEKRHRRITFLLIAVTAMQSLIQFPMSAPIYFFYVAPLLALAALGVLRISMADWSIPLVLAVFYIAFTVRWFHTGYVYQMGDYYAAHPPTEPLQLPRGGIRVVAPERVEVERMAAYVDAFARSDYILALPDAPEVYFLTGKRNPTRALFDFFDRSPERVPRILRALETDSVNLVVVNEGPAVFSKPPRGLLDTLATLYPRVARDGRFLIRWRD